MTEYGACSYPLYSLLGLSSVLLTRGEHETEADNKADKSSFSMMLWDVVMMTWWQQKPVSPIYSYDSLHKCGDKGNVGTHLQFI